MSNFVEQIKDGLNSTIAATLTDYSELSYVYELEKNDFRNQHQRYGVSVRGAASALSITKNYTVDHSFEVILTRNYVNKPSDDKDLRASIDLLYTKMDDVLKQAFQTKLGIPNIVLNVQFDSYEEPEILEENKLVALRMLLLITYRNSII